MEGLKEANRSIDLVNSVDAGLMTDEKDARRAAPAEMVVELLRKAEVSWADLDIYARTVGGSAQAPMATETPGDGNQSRSPTKRSTG